MSIRERLGLYRRSRSIPDIALPQTEICHKYDLSIAELCLDPDKYGRLVFAVRQIFVPDYGVPDHEKFTLALDWSTSNRKALRSFFGGRSELTEDTPDAVREQIWTHCYPCCIEDLCGWRDQLTSQNVTFSSLEEIKQDVASATIEYHRKMMIKNDKKERKVAVEPVKLEPNDITNLVLKGNGHRDHGETDLITWHVLQAYLTALLGRARAAVNNGQY